MVKMQRKQYFIILLCIILIAFWIHSSSNKELNNTIEFLESRSNSFQSSYLLQPKKPFCSGNPLFIIVVTSYVSHVELRSAHRRTVSNAELQDLNVKRVFLLGAIPKQEKFITQEAIKDEFNIYGDILQGAFTENYRNLTTKNLMGLQWVANMCHDASFILKVDDDTVFNFNITYQFILELSHTVPNRDSFLMGYMLNNTIPRRNKQNKWYVTYEEYPRSIYPPYLSGWYYITTPNTASRICEEVIYHQKFWIDDIFITGIVVESLGIKLRHLPNNFWLQYYELLECCLKDVINKNIQCNYVVGPNGGRNNLILEFNKIVQKCESNENCKPRSIDQDVHKSCVVSNNREIFGQGHPEIMSIKLL